MTKDNWIKACKRCGKPYPVEGVMVCPCHPMFSPNYEPEPPIEFKTEKDCQRFIDWMYVSEVERKIELKDAIEKTNKRWELRANKKCWDIQDEDGVIIDTVVSLSDLLEDK